MISMIAKFDEIEVGEFVASSVVLSPFEQSPQLILVKGFMSAVNFMFGEIFFVPTN